MPLKISQDKGSPWHERRFVEVDSGDLTSGYKRYGWGDPEKGGFMGWFLLVSFFASMIWLLLSHF